MKFRGARRVAKLLETHAETIYLARRLTGLITDNTLSSNLTRYTITPDTAALETVFEQLGFSEKRRQRWLNLLEKIPTEA